MSRRAAPRAALGCALPLLLSTGAAEGRPEPARHEFSHAAMGTEFRIVLFAESAAGGEAAAREAFERVDGIEHLLSDYRPDSEVSALAATAGAGEAVPVERDTWQALLESRAVAEGSGGAFDVTVGPLTRLWRRAARRGELPDPARLDEARAAVGWDGLRLDPRQRTVTLARPGMRLDLGGIAKGYAVDAAYELLRARGFEQILVDGGGDLRLGDPPPGRRGWRIAFPEQGTGGEPAWRTRELARTAVATSGPSRRSVVVDGVRHSHILDPRTGRALTTDRWVTVLAPTATRADAIASALSVLGEPGRETARALGAREASVIEMGKELR